MWLAVVSVAERLTISRHTSRQVNLPVEESLVNFSSVNLESGCVNPNFMWLTCAYYEAYANVNVSITKLPLLLV